VLVSAGEVYYFTPTAEIPVGAQLVFSGDIYSAKPTTMNVQVFTNGSDIDADATYSIANTGTEDLDLVVLENVGNLVCPAEFDTGAVKNTMILSVPEGDDKPLKYPLMFTVTQAVLVNKTDTRKFFAFDDEAFVERVHSLNPLSEIFFVSAKTGDGFDAWISWLRRQIMLSKAM